MNWWDFILVDFGSWFFPFLVTTVLGLLGKYVWDKDKEAKESYWLQVARRATEEALHAGLEIQQTYVKEIKRGREDGKLTTDERSHAINSALDIAKANLGPDGFAKLVKIFKGSTEAADDFLLNRIESQLPVVKAVSENAKKQLPTS